MNVIFIALLPTILLLVLGNVLRRRGFVPLAFWAAGDKLTYFVLFPAMLVTKVSQVDLGKINFSQIFLFVLLYFAFLSLLTWGIYRQTKASPNQFSSLYQGILRFNSYVYFAIVGALWGSEALAMAALIAGVVIPMVNVCCVASFAVGSGDFSLLRTLKTIIKNPLIIAALLGFIANLFPLILPQVLFDTLAILAKAALPLALLSVGAAVQIKMLFVASEGFSQQALWLGTFARLIIAPMVALLLANLLHIHEEILLILVVFAAVPTATSSYILAKQLQGDAQMMATIISLQTVLSVLTLVFWLHLLS